MKKILAIITAAGLFAGCADTTTVLLDSSLRPPTASVDVYKDGAKPPPGARPIGELSWRGPRSDELKAQRYFMKKAAELGGNGIFFTTMEADTRSNWGVAGGGGFAGGAGAVTTEWLFKAKVLVYAAPQ